jgi:hypothetical protein
VFSWTEELGEDQRQALSGVIPGSGSKAPVQMMGNGSCPDDG